MPSLHPILQRDDAGWVVITHRIGPVDKKTIGPLVASLSEYRDDIIRALDVLLTGF